MTTSSLPSICRAAAILVCTCAAVALACAPAAGAASATRCSQHAYGSMELTPEVVVFAGPAADDGSIDVYACRRPGGAPVRVATELPDDGQYGSDSVIEAIEVSGTWVAASVVEGAADASVCGKVMPGAAECGTAATVLHVVDTRTRRTAEVGAGATATQLALSPAGALAWVGDGVLRAALLRPRGRHALDGRVRELDRGTVTKVHFHGRRTLHWRSGGGSRSALV